MTGFEICAAVVMAGGLPPVLVLAATGRPVDRLIGVQLASTTAVVAMLLVAQEVEPYDLVVPLVLAVLSVVGTLVFTRLIGNPDDGP